MKSLLHILVLIFSSFFLTSCFLDGETTAFTISGTVTGLEGTGLVLQNNGRDDITISADGRFTFVTPLTNGSVYSVTVLTQPSSPDQICTVTNGSGILSGGNIANVLVTCLTTGAYYTIGGSITGLSGTGLVLQNNGTDNLSITTNGSFTFVTALTDGIGYSVTVLTQPTSPSQICAVTNGAGTVSGANITNVAITCTTNSYSIGGQVNGLAGTGLVLQNNATDDLDITANGNFTFATAITDGTGYSVTVLTQPTSPSQVCAVTNGSGTVSGANITNVVITCTTNTTNTYSIGGTVSGLAGTGLVLQNNSTDDLVITADGDFTFSAYITDGNGYSVTVLTQPTGLSQTCAVSNGSGTVSGANVTNVAITCTTNTYTIGGSVTGLAGTGLVLQNNDGDDLPITGDGSFTFATAITDGNNYNVTVLTQPSSPNQNCTVTNEAGTLAGSNVTNVSVSCVTNTYTIGGSVTGLAGTGLVLQNNDGDDLPITGDGSFTFATAITDGNNYNVTVLTQPSTPSQICAASNASGTLTGSNVTTVTVTCMRVMPLYPTNGVNWNDYVQGNDITVATDTACNAATDTTCLHGGEIRMAELTGTASCIGITASDALDAFDWTCDDSTGVVRVISTGIASGYGLADLLDFTTPAWKENSLTIYMNAAVIETTPSTVWWTNPVVTNITGATLDASGTVYVVPTNTVGITYEFTASKVALVAAPGISINGPTAGLNSFVISATGSDFLWLEEMTVNATGDDIAIFWDTVRFSVMQNLTAGYADTGAAMVGISLRTASYNKLSGVTADNNAHTGLRLTGSPYNTLSEITASNNEVYGIHLSKWLNTTSSYNTLSNVTVTNNNYPGLYLSNSPNNTFAYITASNNTRAGIELNVSSNNMLSNVTAKDNQTNGISITASSDNNTLSNVIATNNTIEGIELNTSSSNTLSKIIASNNRMNGLALASSSDNNIILDVNASNNSRAGVGLGSSSNNMLLDVIASNNSERGIWLVTDSNNNTLSNVTANNNGKVGNTLHSGIAFDYSSNNNTLSNVTANNNAYVGIRLYDSSNNTLLNLTAANNYWYGISLLIASNNYFTGALKVGSNSFSNCYVLDGTNPGLVDSTCANNGASDAALTTGVSITSSFIAKVTTDDTANTSDSNGSATVADFILLFDWANFENIYRAWGVDGNAFPDPTNQGGLGCSDTIYTNQTDCEANAATWASDARIWDWSLQASDTVIKDALSLSTGNDVLTHTWADTSSTTFLRNAVEIQDDVIGNDNTLCETGETCLYTPNIGSYQGHGNHISAGSIGTGGTLENITLMKHETNGY